MWDVIYSAEGRVVSIQLIAPTNRDHGVHEQYYIFLDHKNVSIQLIAPTNRDQQ